MEKPVILVVDDDPQVLSALKRDLRARYRSRYGVLSTSSGEQALSTVKELKRGGGVAHWRLLAGPRTSRSGRHVVKPPEIFSQTPFSSPGRPCTIRAPSTGSQSTGAPEPKKPRHEVLTDRRRAV